MGYYHKGLWTGSLPSPDMALWPFSCKAHISSLLSATTFFVQIHLLSDSIGRVAPLSFFPRKIYSNLSYYSVLKFMSWSPCLFIFISLTWSFTHSSTKKSLANVLLKRNEWKEATENDHPSYSPEAVLNVVALLKYKHNYLLYFWAYMQTWMRAYWKKKPHTHAYPLSVENDHLCKVSKSVCLKTSHKTFTPFLSNGNIFRNYMICQGDYFKVPQVHLDI